MAGLPTPDYDLATIAGVDCHTPAWQLTNSHVLCDPAPKDRDNVKLYGVDGVLARASTKGPRTVGLEFYVTGDVNLSGTPYGDKNVGVETNIAYLRDNMYHAAETDGAVLAVVETATGAYHSGWVQLDDFEAQPGIGSRFVFIQATLIDGELTVGGGS